MARPNGVAGDEYDGDDSDGDAGTDDWRRRHGRTRTERQSGQRVVGDVDEDSGPGWERRHSERRKVDGSTR